jgi:hypothetical protein
MGFILQVERGGKFHCARLAQAAVKFSGSKQRAPIALYRAQIYAVLPICAIKFNN